MITNQQVIDAFHTVGTRLNPEHPWYLMSRAGISLESLAVSGRMAEYKGKPIADLELLKPNERAELLAELNLPVTPLPQIPQNTLNAIFEVESNGRAFGHDGRLLIRFEPAIFFKHWPNGQEGEFLKHWQFGECDKWFNPANGEWLEFHNNHTREWQAFNTACEFDEEAAMLSTSLGAPQIMGFNFQRCGYTNVHQMFIDFERSIANQQRALIEFIKSDTRLSQAIALQDLETFARLYNGNGNVSLYADKLRKALCPIK